MHRRIGIVGIKETVRISALVGAITLGLVVQNLAGSGGPLDPRAVSDGFDAQWLASPVSEELLDPYLG